MWGHIVILFFYGPNYASVTYRPRGALLAVGSIRSAREQAGGSLHFQLGIPTPEHANPT